MATLAPDFSVTDDSGATIDLRDLRGGHVVLFFYPKANSRGGTQQACAFRDAYERFTAAVTHVIGISSDAVGDQPAFTAKASCGTSSRRRRRSSGTSTRPSTCCAR